MDAKKETILQVLSGSIEINSKEDLEKVSEEELNIGVSIPAISDSCYFTKRYKAHILSQLLNVTDALKVDFSIYKIPFFIFRNDMEMQFLGSKSEEVRVFFFSKYEFLGKETKVLYWNRSEIQFTDDLCQDVSFFKNLNFFW